MTYHHFEAHHPTLIVCVVRIVLDDHDSIFVFIVYCIHVYEKRRDMRCVN